VPDQNQYRGSHDGQLEKQSTEVTAIVDLGMMVGLFLEGFFYRNGALHFQKFLE
jgi:hypothetical protein